MIGLSGGPDSVCLFHVLKALRGEMDFSLYAVHVNHRFRPGAAEEDQAFVERLCKREGVPCKIVVRDCPKIAAQLGLSGEEAGRKVRYEAFSEMAAELRSGGIPMDQIKVAVAQNADDQAETVLMRLLRGTGPDGLAGIAYLRKEKGLAIIRPLLDVWRDEIEDYCKAEELTPRIDHTNLEPVYTRNKVRLLLIPYLREHFNENISQALIRLAGIAAEDKEFLWKITEQTYKELMITSGSLRLAGLAELDAAIRHRVILKAFGEAGLEEDITAAHLEAADRLVLAGKTGKTLDFPAGFRMTIDYGQVRFYRQAEQQAERKKRKLSARVVEKQAGYPFGSAVFDWEKICAEHGKEAQVCLRSRGPGDYIRLKNGSKKLQDFFVDKKIPRGEREQVPVAAIGKEILWILADGSTSLAAHRYSEKYKLDEATKMVLVLEILCDI